MDHPLPQAANNAPSKISRDAPRPTVPQLATKLSVFLGFYWQDPETDMEYEARLATWCDCLSDLPWEAVEWAINDRLKSPDRRKPIPGEIRQAALSRLEPLAVQRLEKPDPPFGDNIKPLSAERARQIAEDLGMQDSPFATGAVRALQLREESE